MAAATIWKIDNSVPVFVNGLGQNRNYNKDTSGGDYRAMSWGDGFISEPTLVKEKNISDPSLFLTTLNQASADTFRAALHPPLKLRAEP